MTARKMDYCSNLQENLLRHKVMRIKYSICLKEYSYKINRLTAIIRFTLNEMFVLFFTDCQWILVSEKRGQMDPKVLDK